MSSRVVREKFEELLKASIPWPFLLVENRNPTVPKDGVGRLLPFVSAMYVSSEQANSIGDPNHRCFRETGSAMALFFAPSNTGMTDLIQTVENFRFAARGREWSLPAPSLRLLIESANPATEYATLKWSHSLGDYYSIASVCTYSYDFLT